jgi:hypothetical protein
MNNISFQGKTDFIVSPNAYNRVAAKTRQTYKNFLKTHNSKLYNNQVCTIKTDPENITVIMRNEKDSFFKYVPINEEGQQNILEELAVSAEKLENSAKKDKVTAWIVGGTKIDGKHGNKVVETLNRIAELICDKANIDTSILVGSKTGEEMFVLRPQVKQLRFALDKKINPKNSLNTELENIFDVVELNNTSLTYMP